MVLRGSSDIDVRSLLSELSIVYVGVLVITDTDTDLSMERTLMWMKQTVVP